jgi:RND family efflux transporter MFP subunit
MRKVTALVGRPRRIAVLAIVVALASGLAVWMLQPEASAESAMSIVAVENDDVVVEVGGVGRIVPARISAEISVPSSTASGTGSVSAPADGVFARTTGHVVAFLVRPGERVRLGQPLARLGDGGASAADVRLAQIELATALIEQRQRQAGDPTVTTRPTSAELAAAQAAVTAAESHLARLLGRGGRADLAAARLELRRAQADLEALQGGNAAARTAAIRVAESNVRAAQARLNQVLAPPSASDVAVAEAELKKAEADLALLLRPRPVRPEQLAAANAAVAAARDKLVQERGQQEPDFAAISAAQAELSRAVAELAVLQNPQQALAEEIAAAEKAVDAARAKLARLLEPPSAADVTAARLELERARAELRALRAGPSQASIAAARQAVDAARARLAQLSGPRDTAADVTAAQLELRRARAELAVLQGRATGSRTDVALGQLKVDAARARLATAQHAHRQLTVRSPFAGIVAAFLTSRGAPVDPTTAIMAITDPSRLAVSVQLSEFDAAFVKPGLKALVSVDALGGKTFAGTVLFAGLTGSESGGVVTFPVRVGLKGAKGLKPGMNASVKIIVAERRDVVQVPLEAVTYDDEDRPTITVVNAAGQTAIRPVTLGLSNNSIVEIAKGLREGERIVLPQLEEEAATEEGGDEGDPEAAEE